MKPISALGSFLLGSVVLGIATGCGGDPKPPEPVATEKAPEGLEEVFKQPAAAEKKAQQDPAVRRMVNDAAEAIRTKNYGKALFTLEALSLRSDLTDAQRDYVTRAMLSVQQTLEQKAGTDPQAREVLEYRRRNK